MSDVIPFLMDVVAPYPSVDTPVGLLTYILLFLIPVIAAVVVIVLLRRRKKKKQEAARIAEAAARENEPGDAD